MTNLPENLEKAKTFDDIQNALGNQFEPGKYWGASPLLARSFTGRPPPTPEYYETETADEKRQRRMILESFGTIHIVRPTARHLATIVWLHGEGEDGSSAIGRLESQPLPNIKFICPTAPTRPLAYIAGETTTVWFDYAIHSEYTPLDIEALDASSAYIAKLLSTEPTGVKLGIGGYGMGGALALYSATCFSFGKYANGSPYPPINLKAVFCLSGWLPGSLRHHLKDKVDASHGATQRAASLPILFCHGKEDRIVNVNYAEKCAETMKSAGFLNCIFKGYDKVGHYKIHDQMMEVTSFLISSLELQQP